MPRYLLDTNILCFIINDADYLTKEVKDILDDYGHQIYVSSETIKEIIHLLRVRRFVVDSWKSPECIFNFVTDEMRFGIKIVKEEHLRTLANLPRFEDHRDPSDMVIIAHAITEKLTLISSDGKFPRYKQYGLDLIFNER